MIIASGAINLDKQRHCGYYYCSLWKETLKSRNYPLKKKRTGKIINSKHTGWKSTSFKHRSLRLMNCDVFQGRRKLTQGHVVVNIWYTTNTPVGFNAFHLYAKAGLFLSLCAGFVVYLLCKVEIYLSTPTAHFILSFYDVICETDRWVDE